MKNIKISGAFFIALLFVSGLSFPFFNSASAESSSNSNPSDIQRRISELMAQIRSLQSQLPSSMAPSATTFAAGSLKDRIEFKQDLKDGVQGEEVRKLQHILATDKAIYPEGLTTGFFGPKTKEALKRFQSKFKLEATGELNPYTRDLVNKLLRAQGVEKDIPPGLLIAPGLKDRIKVELKDENGRFKYEIEVKEDKNKIKENIKRDHKFEIEVEQKNSHFSKVKYEREDGHSKIKRVFLIKSIDRDFIIGYLADKLGLDESVVEAVIEFDSDSDEDENDDGDEDDDSDDDEDEEDDEDEDDDN